MTITVINTSNSSFSLSPLPLCRVVLILVSYTGMFYSIRRTRANTPLSLGDREFAMRFFFIVFTDCLCWTPIIVLRIMALSDVDIKRECVDVCVFVRMCVL